MDINAFMATPTPQLADMLMQAHPNVDPTPALHAMQQGGLGGGTPVGTASPPNAGFGVAGIGQTTGPDAAVTGNVMGAAGARGVSPRQPMNLAALGLAKEMQQQPPTMHPYTSPGGHPAQFINPQTASSAANVGPARKRVGSLGDILGGLK